MNEEAKRRRMFGLQRVDSPKQKGPRNARTGTASSTGAISAAKANVVRAAFRAGVKPNAIAHQSGLSYAAVRESEVNTQWRIRSSERSLQRRFRATVPVMSTFLELSANLPLEFAVSVLQAEFWSGRTLARSLRVEDGTTLPA